MNTSLVLFPLQIYPPESSAGNQHQLDEAIKVMASHVVELHDNGGEVIHVPPGEDISERLVPVTADGQGSNSNIEESGEGKNLANHLSLSLALSLSHLIISRLIIIVFLSL